MENIVNRTVLVGNVKMSLFSFIIAGAGILLGLVIGFKVNIFAGLLMTASLFVAAYNLNCVIVGQCKIWAWVLFIVYILQTVLVLSINPFNMRPIQSPSRKSKK